MTTPYQVSSPALDPLFWPSARADAISAWHEHVPFGHWLVSSLKPQVIVELGVHTGVSYASFCEAVRRLQLRCRCFGIDTWKGDEQAGFYDETIFTDIHRFHDARYSKFSQLLRANFQDALAYFPDGSIDLLHIDGNHTYDAVSQDFYAWSPKLSDRSVILFHDIAEYENDFGVWKLWQSLAQKYPSFSFLHGHGLGVLAMGHHAGDLIAQICASAELDVIERVRARFVQLGHYASLRHQEALRSSSEVDKSERYLVAIQGDKLNRKDSILRGANLSEGRSLEIGPLHRPLLLKSDGDVIYADHASTHDLVRKYSKDINVLAQDITQIDIVVDEGGLVKALDRLAPFTNIVASHVLEHVPDLLGWVEGATSLLRDGGLLCLALPDRRYTFDMFRRPSTLKDVLEAHDERRTRPSLELVCDAYRNSVGIAARQAWQDDLDPSSLDVGWPVSVQRDVIERHLNGDYIDVHCWVFSPSECLQLLFRIVDHCSLPMAPIYFKNTFYGEEEFHLQIVKCAGVETRHAWQSVIAAARDNHITWETRT